jgi:hypothetical protein
MSHRISKTLALRRLAQIVLPAAVAAFLVIGTSPAHAQDATQVNFQASYQGLFTPQIADDGTITVNGALPGDATFLPGSIGYFSHSISPTDPTTLNGAFMLFGGDNGTVSGIYQGTQTLPDANGVVQISGAYSLMDGWMDGFGAAMGSGAISGVVNLNTGEIAIQLIGAVSPATPSPS